MSKRSRDFSNPTPQPVPPEELVRRIEKINAATPFVVGEELGPLPLADMSPALWISVAAAVAGGLAANTGNQADPEQLRRIACETADALVIQYQTRVAAGAL